MSNPSTRDGGVVHDFVDALLARDWPRFRATLTNDVYREGFEGAEIDSVRGIEPYMKWTTELIDPLFEYSWVVHRIAYSADGDAAFLEATSTYRVREEDEPFGYRMAVIFDLTSDQRIAQLSWYWKTPAKKLAGGTISGDAP